MVGPALYRSDYTPESSKVTRKAKNPAALSRDANRRTLPAMSQLLDSCLDALGLGSVLQREALGGGCISDVARLTLSGGGSLILKQNPQAPADMFPAEAAGLAALRDAGTLRVPRVVHAQADYILLEDLGRGAPATDYWDRLGEGLAQLHGESRSQFGFGCNNYCGATPQDNSPLLDGHEFFARFRLLALAREARQRELIGEGLYARLQSIARRLPELVPKQRAVLLHGDLWSGNVHCCSDGLPALIDPASYWGWAEADLAMTLLFGGFAPSFYEAYEGNSGLDPGWQERAPLYNLYHLLNHLLLFGGSYLAQLEQDAARFG